MVSVDNSCLFCKIARKEIPATLLYEDRLVVAFADIHPQAPEHVLIIPKAHYSTLNDVSFSPSQATFVKRSGSFFSAFTLLQLARWIVMPRPREM